VSQEDQAQPTAPNFTQNLEAADAPPTQFGSLVAVVGSHRSGNRLAVARRAELGSVCQRVCRGRGGVDAAQLFKLPQTILEFRQLLGQRGVVRD
jgi:hypothetical protein